MAHLLVTNDFPPKVGGIQSYLWELWRRLPPERFTVVTTPAAGDTDFDRAQPFRIERVRSPVLMPTPGLVRYIRQAVERSQATLVVLDPVLPLGLVTRSLGPSCCLVIHGAEVTVPARLPGASSALGAVLRGADHVIAAGHYPLSEARRAAGSEVPATVVPPGVDTSRFRPLTAGARRAAREAAGLPGEGPLVVSVSRLVPRKGMDVLIAASVLLGRDRPNLTVAIAGEGRDLRRLQRLARTSGAPVRFLGRVEDEMLPSIVGSADVFAMLCRRRWGGLEQEGFGIVFLEAAACGVPQVAGDSGGAAEAVSHGETGLLVNEPEDPVAAAAFIAMLLDDDDLRLRLGDAARRRAEKEFNYDHLAARLDRTLVALEGRTPAAEA